MLIEQYLQVNHLIQARNQGRTVQPPTFNALESSQMYLWNLEEALPHLGPSTQIQLRDSAGFGACACSTSQYHNQ
jgi:hypothetical protein